MQKEISLKLNEQQINTILAGLSELPFKVSASLIEEVLKQAKEQVEEVKE